jgi:hypothetical protein
MKRPENNARNLFKNSKSAYFSVCCGVKQGWLRLCESETKVPVWHGAATGKFDSTPQ